MAQLCIKIRLYLWHSHFHALFRRARGCQPLYLICSRNFHICFQFFSKLFFQLGKGICTKCHFADLLCYVFCKSAFHCLCFQITFQCLHICTVQQILSIHRFGRINIHGNFDIFPCLRLISDDILSIWQKNTCDLSVRKRALIIWICIQSQKISFIHCRIGRKHRILADTASIKGQLWQSNRHTVISRIAVLILCDIQWQDIRHKKYIFCFRSPVSDLEEWNIASVRRRCHLIHRRNDISRIDCDLIAYFQLFVRIGKTTGRRASFTSDRSVRPKPQIQVHWMYHRVCSR